MGVAAWAHPGACLRRHAHGLVKALAQRCQHAEQGRKGGCPLPRLEHGGFEAAVRGSTRCRLGARDDGYRSGCGDDQRRLFSGIVCARNEPLPDRDAGQPRPGARIRRTGHGELSKAGKRQWVSGPGHCYQPLVGPWRGHGGPSGKITMPVKNEPTTTATGGVEHYVWNDMTAEPLKGTITRKLISS